MPMGIRRRPKENGITGSMIIITIIFFLLVLLLTIPNIYLDNNIYYESREIAHYEAIAQTLREEQSIIKHKLEDVKYQESVINGD
jgi:preprotein translocase subunit SecG